MRVAGTDMHILTLIFIIVEIVLLIFLAYHCLTRPSDNNRKRFAAMLVLLIIKNIAMGLFPDPGINIHMVVQYGLTYGAGFILASYFPYYFYATYDLKGMRFHALYGIFLFLYLPFIVVFLTEYRLTGDIDSAIAHGLYIPAAYSLILAYTMFKSIKKAFQTKIRKKDYLEVIAIYCSVVPFVAIAFFPNISQVTEAIITNGGFTFVTLLFIKNNVVSARLEHEKLEGVKKKEREDKTDNRLEDSQVLKQYEANLAHFNLTNREKEVAGFMMKGYTAKETGETLFISHLTVQKHTENIYKKTSVNSKRDLADKLTGTGEIS